MIYDMRPPMSVGELLVYWLVFIVFGFVVVRAIARKEITMSQGFVARRSQRPVPYWTGTIIFFLATLLLLLIVVTQTYRHFRRSF